MKAMRTDLSRATGNAMLGTGMNPYRLIPNDKMKPTAVSKFFRPTNNQVRGERNFAGGDVNTGPPRDVQGDGGAYKREQERAKEEGEEFDRMEGMRNMYPVGGGAPVDPGSESTTKLGDTRASYWDGPAVPVTPNHRSAALLGVSLNSPFRTPSETGAGAGLSMTPQSTKVVDLAVPEHREVIPGGGRPLGGVAGRVEGKISRADTDPMTPRITKQLARGVDPNAKRSLSLGNSGWIQTPGGRQWRRKDGGVGVEYRTPMLSDLVASDADY
jgi:hypothetical protein